MRDWIFGKAIAVLAILYFAACGPASADEEYDSSLPTSLLDGMTFIYSYIDGNGTAYRVSFEDGLFDWEGVSFTFEEGSRLWKSRGSAVKGSIYKAHKLGNDEYMMYFIEHSPEGDLEWGCLHLNFNTNQVFGAGLFNYGENRADPHLIFWAPGFIYNVTRND